MTGPDRSHPDHPDAIDVGAPDPNDDLAVRIATDPRFERRSSAPGLLRWGDRMVMVTWLAVLGIGIAVFAIGTWGAVIFGLVVIAVVAAMFWLRGHARRAALRERSDH